MYFPEIGAHIRDARKHLGLTQAALADAAGLSRVTINQLEGGVVPDLGVKKLSGLLAVLGLSIQVMPTNNTRTSPRDYLQLACRSANVSYRDTLTPEELAQAMLTGKVAPEKRPHLRVVFDEVPSSIFEGLVEQVAAWGHPKKVATNVRHLAQDLGSARRI